MTLHIIKYGTLVGHYEYMSEKYMEEDSKVEQISLVAGQRTVKEKEGLEAMCTFEVDETTVCRSSRIWSARFS